MIKQISRIVFFGWVALLLLAGGGQIAAQYAPTHFVGTANCDDTGSGTRDKPFCSVQVGLDQLTAGDVLMLLDGVYHERVYLGNSGTADQPIVVTGESQNAILDAGCPSYPCEETVIMDGQEYIMPSNGRVLLAGFFIGWEDYIILDGFTVRNAPDNGIELRETRGVTLQNMRVQNAVRSIINVYDSSDFKLLHNVLSGGNLGWVTAEGKTIHITFEEAASIVNTDGFEIAYNHLVDGFKEGLDLKVGSRNGTVHHNTVERFCAVGIYLTEASYVDVFANTISDIGFIRNTLSDIAQRSDTLQRCDEIRPSQLNRADLDEPVTLDYEPGNGIMIAIGDLGYGLDTGKLSDVRIYQNVVHNVNVGCIVLWDELRETGRGEPGILENVQIFNNTLYNCARSRANWGPGIILDISAVDTRITNNIIALTSEAVVDNGSTNTTIANNLFFQAGEPVGVPSMTGDPLFVSPGTGDFHLQAGSPAVDVGMDVGLPFNGDKPDLGAYEFEQ